MTMLMHWTVAAATLVVLGGALPWMIRAMKPRPGKRRGGGGLIAIGMALMTVLDGPKAAAIEQIDKRKDLGDTEAGEGGERID